MAAIDPEHRATFPDRPQFDMAIAGWSERRDQPELYFWTNDAEGPVEPRRLIDQPFVCVGPEYDAEQLTAAGWSKPETEADFDAPNDGLAILQAMRLAPGPVVVGGFVELATVTRDWVRREVFRVWPDWVGRPIAPTAPAIAEAA
jgi:hypothetical protein